MLFENFSTLIAEVEATIKIKNYRILLLNFTQSRKLFTSTLQIASTSLSSVFFSQALRNRRSYRRFSSHCSFSEFEKLYHVVESCHASLFAKTRNSDEWLKGVKIIPKVENFAC